MRARSNTIHSFLGGPCFARLALALALLVVGLLVPGCEDKAPPETVARPSAPGAGGFATESSAQDPTLVDVGMELPGAQTDRTKLGEELMEVEQVEIQVTAPAGLADGALPRLILIDPDVVAEGFEDAIPSPQRRWSWAMAEAFGEELEFEAAWSRDDGEAGGTAGFSLEVPRPSHGSRVLGRLGERVAVGTLPASSRRPWVLDLSEPTEVIREVRVSRADGRAAKGVEVLPVARTVRTLSPMKLERSALAHLSDANGRVELPVQPSNGVAARVIAGDPVLGTGTDPCRIALPRAATVQVRMEFPMGFRLGDEEIAPTVRVKRFGGGGGKHEDLGIVAAQGGSVRLYPVAAGAKLIVEGSAGGWEGTAQVEVPPQDGAELAVAIPMLEVPAVEFTAVDLAGQPIVGASFGVRISFPRAAEFTATSAEDGRVVCWLPSNFQPNKLANVYIREIVESKDVNDGRVAMVILQDKVVRSVDLGIVTLRPVPTIVAGRTVDGEGNPMSRVRLEVDSSGGGGLILRGSQDSPPFPGAVEWAKARSGSTGAFSIRMGLPDGSLPDEELCLSGRRGGAMTLKPVAFSPSEENLVVALELGAALHIDTRRHKSDEMPRARLSLRRKGGGDRYKDRTVRFGRDQVIKKLRPGSYSLLLYHASRGDVVVLDGIDVQAGATVHDARLNPLDLSGLLEFRSLLVLSVSGDPPSTFRLGMEKSNGAIRSTKIRVIGGRAMIPVWPQSEPSSYVVQAEGFRDIELPAILHGAVLEFEEGIVATLQLAGADLPGDVCALSLRTRRTFSSGSASFSTEHVVQIVAFDTAGRARIKVPKAGSYLLTWSSGMKLEGVRPWVGTEFEVPEEGGVVKVLPLDQ